MHVNKLLICLLSFKLVRSQNYEGDLCRITSTGISGQCKLISACPSAIQALQAHEGFPQICGFAKNQEIIACCTGSSTVTSFTPKPPTPPTRRTTVATSRTTSIKSATSSVKTTTVQRIALPLSVGDKSKQKCQEYEKYVYRQSAAFGVLGSSTNPLDDSCALGEVENIVGGNPAKPREFPHMALLGFEGDNREKKWKCAGILVSEKFVLTAAHCLNHREYGDVKYIRLGELVITSNTDDAEPQEFHVQNVFEPPNRTPASPYDDIALLEMNKEAELNTYVRPACLNVNSRLTNNLALASGWGQTAAGSKISESLLKVTLEMFTNQECNDKYKHFREGIKDDTQICAGSHNDSRDTCHGDSGGPLQIISSETYCSYEIIGVTSFGRRCGEANSPGIYTRVSAYIKWIEDTVWP